MSNALFGLLLLATLSAAMPPWMGNDYEDGSSSCSPGLYARGCGPEVSVCTDDGNLVELVCPFSLWFDELTESCVPPSDVTFCRSMDSSSALFPSASLPATFCSGLPNGFHSISQCSASMARCMNGTAAIFECPAGQIYTNGGCTNMDEARECQNRANDDECSSDGLFEVDTCSPLFLACASGISHVMTCPWPLVFDPHTTNCNYDYEVSGCPLKPNKMCPADGFYSYGNCTDTFYACVGDFIYPMHCPSQLAFNGESKICDYPDAVPECSNGTSGEGSGSGNDGSGQGSGMGSGESSGEGSGESSGEGSGESSGEGSGFDLPYSRTLDAFCNGKDDGFYDDGCSSTLLGCSNGLTSYLYCPAKLAFDQKRVICDYPDAVEVCRRGSAGSGSGDESSGSGSGDESGSGLDEAEFSPYFRG